MSALRYISSRMHLPEQIFLNRQPINDQSFLHILRAASTRSCMYGIVPTTDLISFDSDHADMACTHSSALAFSFVDDMFIHQHEQFSLLPFVCVRASH